MALTLSSVDSTLYISMSFYIYGSDLGESIGEVRLTNPSNGAFIILSTSMWSQTMVCATTPSGLAPYISNGTTTITISNTTGSASTTVNAVNDIYHGDISGTSVECIAGLNDFGQATVGTEVVLKFMVTYSDNYTGELPVTWIPYYNGGTLQSSIAAGASNKVAINGGNINFTYGSSTGYWFYTQFEVNGTQHEGSYSISTVVPRVDSITPSTGTVGNANFTIAGQGFQNDNSSAGLTAAPITFEGTTHAYAGVITVASQDNTSLVGNANSMNIQATRTYYVRVNGIDTSIVYTLQVVTAPTITNPTVHSARYGDTITITGTNFTPTTYFVGQVGTGPLTPFGGFTYVSATQVQVAIPQPDEQTAVTINMYAYNESKASNVWSLTINKSLPLIMDPTPHYCVKGVAIFVGGRFFGTSGNVKLNGVTLSLPNSTDLAAIKNTIASRPENAGGDPPADASSLTQAWNSNIIVALIPSGATGGNITVTNSEGISNSWAITVVDLGVPDCTEATPNGDKTQCTLKGERFGDIRGSVKANGQNCSIVAWSNNEVTVQLPTEV